MMMRKLVKPSAACLLLLIALTFASATSARSAVDREPSPAAARQQETEPGASLLEAPAPSGNAETTCPEWQAPPTASYQGFPNAGLYTFFDWPHLDPDVYPWIQGGHTVPTWRAVESDGPGQYRWEQIDQWIAAEAALGKTVGLGFNTYEGWCCGGNQVPAWYNAAHGAWPAGDGYVTCRWTDTNGVHQEDIPMYWTPSYLAAFEAFVAAAAERYRDDPRIAFIEVSTGIYGETVPVETDDEALACLAAAGLTSSLWVQTIDRIVDIYQRHWHDTPLLSTTGCCGTAMTW